MTKVLITGVAGLLGTHLANHLLSKGYEIIGIDNLSGGYKDFVSEKVNFHQFDLINTKKLGELFKLCKPDYVYHFAAYAAEGLSPFIRNFNYTNNVLCSVNVINECIKHDIKKIIFTSSMAVYGEGNPPYTEDQIPSPIDPYGIAKFTVEQDLKQAYEQFGLNYSIVRPHNVIGIYQNIWDRYRNVIGIWIRQILEKKPLTIFGDGSQKRAFSDISFCMDPFTRLMEEYNDEIFNIGADKEYKIVDVAKILCKVVSKYGFNSNINHLEPRHEVHTAFSDHTKAKKMLDFVDETELEKVMDDMFRWANFQPIRDVKIIDYEIDKGMYSFWKK